MLKAHSYACAQAILFVTAALLAVRPASVAAFSLARAPTFISGAPLRGGIAMSPMARATTRPSLRARRAQDADAPCLGGGLQGVLDYCRSTRREMEAERVAACGSKVPGSGRSNGAKMASETCNAASSTESAAAMAPPLSLLPSMCSAFFAWAASLFNMVTAAAAKLATALLLVLCVSAGIPALAASANPSGEQPARIRESPQVVESRRWMASVIQKVASPVHLPAGGPGGAGACTFVAPPEPHAVQMAEDDVVVAKCEGDTVAAATTGAQKEMLMKGALYLVAAVVAVPILARVPQAVAEMGGALVQALLGNKECVAVKMIQVVATGPQARLLQVGARAWNQDE